MSNTFWYALGLVGFLFAAMFGILIEEKMQIEARKTPLQKEQEAKQELYSGCVGHRIVNDLDIQECDKIK